MINSMKQIFKSLFLLELLKGFGVGAGTALVHFSVLVVFGLYLLLLSSSSSTYKTNNTTLILVCQGAVLVVPCFYDGFLKIIGLFSPIA